MFIPGQKRSMISAAIWPWPEKTTKSAEHYWRLYIAADPAATDTLEKLAKLSESSEHWPEAVNWRTRALAQDSTAAGLIARANDYLQLRAWDRAFADVNKANAIDTSDGTVKEALPRFERLGEVPAANQDAGCADREIANGASSLAGSRAPAQFGQLPGSRSKGCGPGDESGPRNGEGSDPGRRSFAGSRPG